MIGDGVLSGTRALPPPSGGGLRAIKPNYKRRKGYREGSMTWLFRGCRRSADCHGLPGCDHSALVVRLGVDQVAMKPCWVLKPRMGWV